MGREIFVAITHKLWMEFPQNLCVAVSWLPTDCGVQRFVVRQLADVRRLWGPPAGGVGFVLGIHKGVGVE